VKQMFDDNDKMARIEREIEKRMEVACEENGWVVAVSLMPPENATLLIEKFAEERITAFDAKMALQSVIAFAEAEFGNHLSVGRSDEKILHARAPYHVSLRVYVDASKRIAELAA